MTSFLFRVQLVSFASHNLRVNYSHFRVSADLTIKIHDFGLAKDQYLKDYYKKREGRSKDDVPVRWLARESLKEGHFSTKSDVVRYAPTCTSCDLLQCIPLIMLIQNEIW